jgi:hypothetical protein
MSEDQTTLTGGELARWLLLAAVLLAGIVAYFGYGPRADSLHAAAPTAAEESK